MSETDAVQQPTRYVAMLADRETWPVVCHVSPAQCAVCLRAIAGYLARELGWDVQAALDRPAQRYRAEMCGPLELGHELRRLTVEACFLQAPSFEGFRRGTGMEDMIVADEAGAEFGSAGLQAEAMEFDPSQVPVVSLGLRRIAGILTLAVAVIIFVLAVL